MADAIAQFVVVHDPSDSILRRRAQIQICGINVSHPNGRRLHRQDGFFGEDGFLVRQGLPHMEEAETEEIVNAGPDG